MLCECAERPVCMWGEAGHSCDEPASWSVMLPRWRGEVVGRVKFMCDGHHELFQEFMTKPVAGIDPPKHADEFWKPSLSDCIRLADINLRFNESRKRR